LPEVVEESLVRNKNEEKESDELKIKVKLEFDTYAVPLFRRKEVCRALISNKCH
jgi:hypothetical protein